MCWHSFRIIGVINGDSNQEVDVLVVAKDFGAAVNVARKFFKEIGISLRVNSVFKEEQLSSDETERFVIMVRHEK